MGARWNLADLQVRRADTTSKGSRVDHAMRKVGRPRIIESPAEMDRLVEEPRATGGEVARVSTKQRAATITASMQFPLPADANPVAPARE